MLPILQKGGATPRRIGVWNASACASGTRLIAGEARSHTHAGAAHPSSTKARQTLVIAGAGAVLLLDVARFVARAIGTSDTYAVARWAPPAASCREGGMGVIYCASHALLRRPTAIKLRSPEKACEHNLMRLEREVQLTSILTQPNTVSINDFGRTSLGSVRMNGGQNEYPISRDFQGTSMRNALEFHSVTPRAVMLRIVRPNHAPLRRRSRTRDSTRRRAISDRAPSNFGTGPLPCSRRTTLNNFSSTSAPAPRVAIASPP
jgi:hypothetical protein